MNDLVTPSLTFFILVRRFTYDVIAQHVPESDIKLLVNIKKRRERLKKQKGAERQEKDKPQDFEEAIYGSESELESENEEEDDDAFIPESLKRESNMVK